MLVILFAVLLSSPSLNAQQAQLPTTGSILLTSLFTHITPSDNVFFIDPANKVLFIDFMPIHGTVTCVNVKQNDKSFFIEDVSHLSSQSIYELPTDLFETGIYQVEIQTQIGYKYYQDILIQSTN